MSILPSRLTMRAQGYCNICHRQCASSSYVFFEEDQFCGWQCCNGCEPKMPQIIQNAKKNMKIHMIQNKRCPIYIQLKPIKSSKLTDQLCLNKTRTGHQLKLKTTGGAIKKTQCTFYTNCSHFRMSQSMNKLIWVDRFGVYETLENLVQLNPEIFGTCFEESIFEINFAIEDKTKKNELIKLINLHY